MWQKKLAIGLALCVGCYFMGADLALAKNDKGNQGNGYGNTGPGNQGNDKDNGNAGGPRNDKDGSDDDDSGDDNGGDDNDDNGDGEDDDRKEGNTDRKSSRKVDGGNWVKPHWLIPPTGICHCDYPINYFFDERCVPLEEGESKTCN